MDVWFQNVAATYEKVKCWQITKWFRIFWMHNSTVGGCLRIYTFLFCASRNDSLKLRMQISQPLHVETGLHRVLFLLHFISVHWMLISRNDIKGWLCAKTSRGQKGESMYGWACLSFTLYMMGLNDDDEMRWAMGLNVCVHPVSDHF